MYHSNHKVRIYCKTSVFYYIKGLILILSIYCYFNHIEKKYLERIFGKTLETLNM